MRGVFVTIEGVEGAGKSTLATAISRELESKRIEVVVTAEPGGEPLAERIRALLLDSKNAISQNAEILLFEAARAQHVDMKIRPALERGAVVICDRFIDSTLAYQGSARGIDFNSIRWLNDFSTSGLRPNLTILLDLPAEEGIRRQNGIDRISSESAAFHEAVREGYLALAEAEPDRFVVIDASRAFGEVFGEAINAVREVIRLSSMQQGKGA